MRVLLAAFEPFGGRATNPSMTVAASLLADPPARLALSGAVLPVTYRDAWPELLRAMQDAQPDAVLLTGLAAGRASLAIERVALNLDDAATPDNAGECRAERPIVHGGPAAYLATLPVRAMRDAMADADVPAEVSLSAGAFLCNHAFYRVCHHAATTLPRLRCGLIHVPLPVEAGGPDLVQIVRGVRAALAVLPDAVQAVA